jgi:hypothetical protein
MSDPHVRARIGSYVAWTEQLPSGEQRIHRGLVAKVSLTDAEGNPAQYGIRLTTPHKFHDDRWTTMSPDEVEVAWRLFAELYTKPQLVERLELDMLTALSRHSKVAAGEASAQAVVAARRDLLAHWLEEIGGIRGDKSVPERPRLWVIGADQWGSPEGPKPIGDGQRIIARNAAAEIYWLILNKKTFGWFHESAIVSRLFEKAIPEEDIPQAMAEEHADV